MEIEKREVEAWKGGAQICKGPNENVGGFVLASHVTLLQRRESERKLARETLRQDLRARLRAALSHLLPGEKVFLFGSLAEPEKFNEYSDIDLALEAEPPGLSVFQLTARLMEETGHPVDVVLLEECRFRDKILSQGEEWTLPG
ncbi:MAG TPA: nucleotidyltransferase domain-containing protein [Chthoniobacterales bacterium]